MPESFTEGPARYFIPVVPRMEHQQEPWIRYYEVCEADARTTACPIIINQPETRHEAET